MPLHDLLDGSAAPTQRDGDDGLRVAFQPVVHLSSRAVIGYEALTRGPRNTDLESPTALFAAARAARRVTELDWRCRLRIFDRALGEGLHPPWTLMINIEPETLMTSAPEGVADLVARAERDLSVVVDLPQRVLMADPARLVAGADRIRSLGWRIALQDLALDDESLGLVGLIAPDIIKLDLHALRRLSARRRVAALVSVTAEVERSGATLLAERVETEEDLEFVEHLGCEYAQGFLFGRARDELSPDRWDGMVLPRAYDGQRPSMLLRERDTPFEVAATGLHRRMARKPFLTQMCRELEAQAVRAGPSTMVLAAFQHARHFDAATAHRYRQIADSGRFVAAIGADMAVEPVAGVRGAMLEDDDPLQDQWVLALLGPQHAVCMAALDMGDDVPEPQRRFRYVLTHRRDRVVAVARALLGRVVADHRRPPRVPIVLPPLIADGPAATDASGDGATGPRATRSGPDAAADAVAHLLRSTDRSLLERTLHAAVISISIADARSADRPLIYVNPAFEQLTGYSAQQVLGRNCRFLQGARTDPTAVRRLRRAVETGTPTTVRLLNYRADGTSFWNAVTVGPIVDEDGEVTHLIGQQRDVTAEVESERRLQDRATHDPLTGLANRMLLQEHAGLALARAQRSGSKVALLYCDLDGFKQVNDQRGHAAGDRLLQRVTARLQSVVRGSDLLARLGGDEFALLLADLPADEARRIVDVVTGHMTSALDEPIPVPGGGPVPIRASIGAGVHPDDGASLDELLRAADAAMYAVKRTRSVRHGAVAAGRGTTDA